MLYVPFRQADESLPAVQLYAHTSMDLARYTALVRNLADRLPTRVKVHSVRTVDEQIESMMQDEKMMAGALTLFGLVALFITAIGLCGVISFDVTRRTQEVGLRKALGAQTADIFGLVFRRAAPWVLGGCVIGLAGAAAMTRLLEAKLFGVEALDPLTFGLAVAFLLLCAGAANYLPARRAASVEPMTALRHD